MITKYQKEQTVTRLKKAYSQLAQAVKLSEIDNGSCDNWNYTTDGQTFYTTYLKKYLSVQKNLGFTRLDNLKISYKGINGEELGNGWTINEAATYRFYLNDGTLLHINTKLSDEDLFRIVYVDINGIKKPNKLGRDLFAFSIQKQFKVTPYGLGYAQNATGGGFGAISNRNTITSDSYNYACNKDKRGLWCAALIMADGWRIADDYPW